MKKIITVIFAAIMALVLAVNPVFAGGPRAPVPPADLTAFSGDGQITLSWTASDEAAKYNIYKKSNEEFLYLNQTTDTTYTDMGLINGTTYYYSVTALNGEESEPSYASATPAVPGIAIVQSDNSTTVIEGGANDTYTIVLNSAPTANVSVSLNPDSQIDFTPRAAEFTKTNWNIPQTITVTAIDDLVYEGPHTAVITHNVFSLDPIYNGISVDSVTVNITDNDLAPGVVIAQSGGSTDVTEAGANDTYTIVLNSVPTADVTVAISPNSQITVSPTKMVFAKERWNMPQTVTVTAVDDSIYEENHTGVITHSASSSDVNYNNISIANITVNIIDNDPAPPSGGGSGGAAIIEEKKKQQEKQDEYEQWNKEKEIALNTKIEEKPLFELMFTDLPATHWAYDFVEKLVLKGIVNGTTENTFEPDKLVTRAELVKMAVLAFHGDISAGVAPFTDIELNVWYAPYVNFAYLKNIIAGYGVSLFGPGNPATRVEALKIILNARGIELSAEPNAPFSDIDAGAWYMPYLNFALEAKIIAGYGDGTFKPDAFLTRAEAVKIIAKSLELK